MLTPDFNDKKTHYLTRLGILPEVQALFYNTYEVDDSLGGIKFNYGDDEIEHFSFAFHKIPSVPTFWRAGVNDFNIITDVIIGSSAMNIIAFLSYKFKTYSSSASILFLSTGGRLFDSHLEYIKTFKKKKITLIYDDDFLGRVADIKVAAALLDSPITFSFKGEHIIIGFKGNSV
ncbi:MAG: hypothetical protein EOP45_08455, partial [Sphingobacteriaceae bacterium]